MPGCHPDDPQLFGRLPETDLRLDIERVVVRMPKAQGYGLPRPNAAVKRLVEVTRSVRLGGGAGCAIRYCDRNVGDRKLLSTIVVTDNHSALDSR